MPQKVLFVCIHNSARSQMAEAFLSSLGGFEAESAGIEPGTLNPTVVLVMKEVGIDISGKQTKSVFDLLQRGNSYDVVITVCDAASAERCPIFPGKARRMAWSFPDPSGYSGSADVLERTREVRDAIKERIIAFIDEYQQHAHIS